MTNQEIAAAPNLSDPTIGDHVGNILDKLGFANRTQAALYALRKGLTSQDEEGDSNRIQDDTAIALPLSRSTKAAGAPVETA